MNIIQIVLPLESRLYVVYYGDFTNTRLSYLGRNIYAKYAPARSMSMNMYAKWHVIVQKPYETTRET